jgi:glucosamine--fructose-6-phosphate aminotransferase (isomerizing)
MTTADRPARAGHPYHMHDAIYAQPGALRLLGRGNAESLEAAAKRLAECERLILAGVGSSRHAALAAERLFASVAGFGHRVRAHGAFQLAHAWPAPDATTGVVVVSHRATNRATHDVLARARAAGAPTVVITARDVESLPHADHMLRTVPAEASQAHTIGYTTAVAMLALLAAAIASDEEIPRALEDVPDQVALLLGQQAWEEMAARFAGRRRYVFVGGGSDAATAFEGALKVSETSYLVASGSDCEEFLHGEWVAMESADLLVLIALPGPAHERCLEVAQVAREVGTPVLALIGEGDRALDGLAAETIEIPEIGERLAPILTVVPLQLLAYHWAVLKGANPDALRAGEPTYARGHAALTR